jgi:hypothetical protein
VQTKNPAPNKAPMLKLFRLFDLNKYFYLYAIPSSPSDATKAVITSPAPLANDNKVTLLIFYIKKLLSILQRLKIRKSLTKNYLEKLS